MASRKIELLLSAKDLASAKVKLLGRSLKRASRDGKKAILGLSSTFLNLKTAIVGAAASLGLFRIGSVGVDAAAQYEALVTQLEALEKSAEKAKVVVAEIDGAFSVTKARKALEIYVSLRRFGLEPTTSGIQALIDTNATLGGSQETLEGIVLALGQAWAKQKLQGEEILQLVERGVPVWDLLAEVTGKTTAEIQDLSSKGELGRQVIADLIAEMGRTNQGAATKGLTKWAGLVDSFHEGWLRLTRLVTEESGLFEFLKTKLGEVNEVFEFLIKSGRAKEWAGQIKQAAIDAVVAIKGQLKSVEDFFSGIKIVYNGITIAINGIGVAATGVSTLVLSGLEKINSLGKKLSPFESVRNAYAKMEEQAKKAKEKMIAEFNEFVDNVNTDADDISDAFDKINEKEQDGFKSLEELIGIANDWNADNAIAEGAESGEAALNTLASTVANTATTIDSIKDKRISVSVNDEGVKEYTDGTTARNDALVAAKKAVKGLGDEYAETKKKKEADIDITQLTVDEYVNYRKQLRETTKENKKQGETAKESAESTSAGLSQAISLTHVVRNNYAGLSDAAVEFFDAQLANVRTIKEWWTVLSDREFERVRAQTESYNAAALATAEALRDGTATAGQFQVALQSADGELSSLSDSVAQEFRAAVAQAEDDINRLNDGFKNTAERLQDELDRLKGDDRAIAERRFQREREELEEGYQEAVRSGDAEIIANAQRALELLRQTHEIKMRQYGQELQAVERINNVADPRHNRRLPISSQPPFPPGGGFGPPSSRNLPIIQPNNQAPTNTRPIMLMMDGSKVAELVTTRQFRAGNTTQDALNLAAISIGSQL